MSYFGVSLPYEFKPSIRTKGDQMYQFIFSTPALGTFQSYCYITIKIVVPLSINLQ